MSTRDLKTTLNYTEVGPDSHQVKVMEVELMRLVRISNLKT